MPLLEIRIRAAAAGDYPVEITFAGREFPMGHLARSGLPWVGTVDAQKDGERLFNWLTADPILRDSWTEIRGSDAPYRVRLRLDENTSDLHDLPWELLTDPAQAGPLAALADTPFSRYPPGSWHPRGLVSGRPLKMLVAVAAPVDLATYKLDPIDLDLEQRLIHAAVAAAPGVAVTFLPSPVSLSSLEAALRPGFHVLHIVSHGRLSPTSGRSALFLANDDNQAQSVLGEDLAGMLARQGRTLRLVFLASCQSAAAGAPDAFGHLAGQVVAAGVPAVLAMRDKVTMALAQGFTAAFYRGLFGHGRVDQAANEARSAVMTGRLPGSWGVAALYSRLPDNRLLQLVDLTESQRSGFAQVAALPAQATQGLLSQVAANQSPAETQRLQHDVNSMLTLLHNAPESEVDIDVAGQSVSQADLLLAKAMLLYTEAEQSLLDFYRQREDLIYTALREAGEVDWSRWHLPVAGPYRTRLRQRLSFRAGQMLQAILGPAAAEVDQERLRQISEYVGDSILTGFDTNIAETRTLEALALFDEIAELQPENTLVRLLIGEMNMILRPDDPSLGQRQLYRLVHQLSPPLTDEDRLTLGKAQLLLATWQDEQDIDGLHAARDLLVDLGADALIGLIDDALVGHYVNEAYDKRIRLARHLDQHTRSIVAQTQDGTYDFEAASKIVIPSHSAEATLIAILRPEVAESIRQKFPGTADVYIDAFLAVLATSYDLPTYLALAEEARTALATALALAPSNAFALLEQANLLEWAEPVANGRERALLEEVEAQLTTPKNKMTRRALGLTLQRLAKISEPIDRVRLARARALFLELNEPDEVAACDRLDMKAIGLSLLADSGAARAPAMARLAQAQAIFADLGERHWEAEAQARLLDPLDPAGTWHIVFNNGVQQTQIVVTHGAGGQLGGQETGRGLFGPVTRAIRGTWQYDAASRTLHITRRVNFLVTTQNKITFTGWADGAFLATDDHGYQYRFSRPATDSG